MSGLQGADEVRRKLEFLAKGILPEAARALAEEAKTIEKESRRRTPVDTGALRDSHKISDPEIRGKNAQVVISVGGPSAPYAVAVHESMENANRKFLQSVVFEARVWLPPAYARRINVRRLLG